MRTIAFVVGIVLAGCASRAGGADAGLACPALAPATGQPCSAPAACLYEHCASNGLVVATCVAGDGGASTWSVTARACTGSCNGSVCSAGTVCAAHSAGAVITQCTTHACGAGPITCDCACGAGVACTLYPTATDGPLFDCYTGCGASICP